MSRLLPALCASLLLVQPALHARENAYDVLGKALAPFTQVLTASPKTKNRAFATQLILEEASAGDPKLAGTQVSFAVEMPDRLRVTAPLKGELVTVCRDGQKIWAYPGARLKALLADPAVAKSLPEVDRKFKLTPFQLPVPEKQLVFLPVLFQVTEAPDEVLAGVTCRVLDLRLMKELAKAIQFKDAKARIWVSPDYALLRIEAHSEQGDATIRLQETKFLPALPAGTWEPTAEESADVLTLAPMVYDQLVRGLIGRGKSGK